MDDNCGEWVESMGVATGCGCKEVYRFPHTTYPYSTCMCSFLQQYMYIEKEKIWAIERLGARFILNN